MTDFPGLEKRETRATRQVSPTEGRTWGTRPCPSNSAKASPNRLMDWICLAIQRIRSICPHGSYRDVTPSDELSFRSFGRRLAFSELLRQVFSFWLQQVFSFWLRRAFSSWLRQAFSFWLRQVFSL